MPRCRPVSHSPYPSTARSASGRSAVRRSATLVMISASSGVVRRRPASRHWSTAASQAARLKMNVIAGSSAAASSRLMISGRLGGRGRAGLRPPRAGAPGSLAGGPFLPPRQPQQLRVHLRRAGGRTIRPAAPGTGRDEQVVEVAVGEHVLPERHRPVLVDDHRRAAADLCQPVTELLGVADRGRQGHDPDRLGQVDDHLFPHRPTEPVGQVVHLVEDHITQPVQGGRATRRACCAAPRWSSPRPALRR